MLGGGNEGKVLLFLSNLLFRSKMEAFFLIHPDDSFYLITMLLNSSEGKINITQITRPDLLLTEYLSDKLVRTVCGKNGYL